MAGQVEGVALAGRHVPYTVPSISWWGGGGNSQVLAGRRRKRGGGGRAQLQEQSLGREVPDGVTI